MKTQTKKKRKRRTTLLSLLSSNASPRTSTPPSTMIKKTTMMEVVITPVPSSSRRTIVYSFGDNNNGALSLSSPLLDAYKPTKIPNLPSSVASVAARAASHYHSLAVTTDSEVWAWGRNVKGQLGRGVNSPSFVFVLAFVTVCDDDEFMLLLSS
ncbi:uncharacterized protein A4U43_C02F10010 [Asparagus officinalis]|uniref:Uncharacterized protein n=1 Tax=Asparagus officinalis TaxID=4686 RepID=A0A5P1FHE7_ASPOF|nr:uncharacterized protein A4U43_C02F10010 [Asparagus officinalis]